MTLSLTLREAPAQRIDMSPLSADHLVGKSTAQVAAMELTCGNRKVRVDGLFTVSGTFASELRIVNGCDKLDRLGEGMTHGSILVQGDVGAYAGVGMQGGHIEVEGNAGAWAASGMSGGMLRIGGNVGDFLAAAVPGAHRGMAGGTVVVSGDAGDRVGDHMRRGMVLIEGNAGDYCAARMGAGTIAVWGTVGIAPGLGMKRGTLLMRDVPRHMLPTFNDCGATSHGFLSLMVRAWRPLSASFGSRAESDVRARRFVGDQANDGRGEILVWA
jgi:formylmethanofuran dehydrogenase subunit C